MQPVEPQAGLWVLTLVCGATQRIADTIARCGLGRPVDWYRRLIDWRRHILRPPEGEGRGPAV